MCTRTFWHRAFDGEPLIVAANRDEQIDRPAAPMYRDGLLFTCREFKWM
jgi:uncharacterized protein with NRDE domain